MYFIPSWSGSGKGWHQMYSLVPLYAGHEFDDTIHQIPDFQK